MFKWKYAKGEGNKLNSQDLNIMNIIQWFLSKIIFLSCYNQYLFIYTKNNKNI